MCFWRLAACCLVLLVIGLYWPGLSHGLLQWDDSVYVSDNPLVKEGFTPSTVAKACTTTVCCNWHPLTVFSHMLDQQLFGDWAGGHHLTSVLFHALNSLLVLSLVWRLCGLAPESLLVAALFAVHPQRVESVAWVAERKDVLCGAFFLGSVLAYLQSVSASERLLRQRWFMVSIGCAGLACLAKPMAVTLPCVLLLLDVWPLRRWSPLIVASREKTALQLIIEKWPFFLLSFVSIAMALIGQAEAISTIEEVSFHDRLINAIVAYATYVRRAIIPTGLAAMYPLHHATAQGGAVAMAATTLAAITLAAVFFGRRMPWLPLGWAWFLGTLVPVIGIVQVGSQSMADRYYYLPGIGLEIAFVLSGGAILRWCGTVLPPEWRASARATALGAAALVVACFAFLTSSQVRTWRDDESLWRHAVATVPRNAVAESLLASALAAKGKTAEAVQHHLAALEIMPGFYDSLVNLGLLLSDHGHSEEAITFLAQATLSRPDDPRVLLNLGICLARLGDDEGAQEAFSSILQRDPRNVLAHFNMAVFLETRGKETDALEHLDTALSIDPNFLPAHEAAERVRQTLARRVE